MVANANIRGKAFGRSSEYRARGNYNREQGFASRSDSASGISAVPRQEGSHENIELNNVKEDGRYDNDNSDEVRKARYPSGPKCYGCFRYGHIKRFCPDLRQKLNYIRRERETFDKAESAKMARFHKWYKRCFINEDSCRSKWLIDSGASCHMCGDENLFSELDRSNAGEVTTASGQKIKCSGVGKVPLHLTPLQLKGAFMTGTED